MKATKAYAIDLNLSCHGSCLLVGADGCTDFEENVRIPKPLDIMITHHADDDDNVIIKYKGDSPYMDYDIEDEKPFELKGKFLEYIEDGIYMNDNHMYVIIADDEKKLNSALINLTYLGVSDVIEHDRTWGKPDINMSTQELFSIFAGSRLG